MGRKKKRFYKDSAAQPSIISDTNAEMLGPKIKDGIQKTIAPITSSKKQRLLDKYIDRKLKKEARGGLYDRLQKVALTSSKLISTKQMHRPVDVVKPAREIQGSHENVSDFMGFPPNRDLEKESSESSCFSSSDQSEYTSDEEEVPIEATISYGFDEFEACKSIKREESEDEVMPLVRIAHLPPTPAFYVTVDRTVEIQEQRSKLPIYGEEAALMDAINAHDVVLVCGATGSGKTTQVPQFLYEGGYGAPAGPRPGMIGITQPRRVAAVSMAQRVSHELGLHGDRVAYQIRHDTTIAPNTSIKFMTDGILLREVAGDFLLSNYSAIVIDEAHERNLNTDILIGLLSRIVRLRREMSAEESNSVKVHPLKLIIMSATLRVSEFTENTRLFSTPPPILSVDARQFPVTMHFSRRTHDDYVAEAFRKICRIHAQLPAGGILVFLTGQHEIMQLMQKLRKRFPPDNNAIFLEANALPIRKEDCVGESWSDLDTDAKVSDEDDFGVAANTNQPLHVLPLFSLLSPEQQMQVFAKPPDNARLCVLATNIAETSLTIPNIKYVVDTGKVKQKTCDVKNGVQSFEIDWISKASADQRAGRAGRTSAGHCYRLYSSALFDSMFAQFTTPEIQRIPIEGIVLFMKNMNIENVIGFPFPTPPSGEALERAEELLVRLEALDDHERRITPLGRIMANFPLTPRHSKMLALALESPILPYAVSLVSTMTIGDPFVHMRTEDDDNDGAEPCHQSSRPALSVFGGSSATSDLLAIMNSFGAYMYEKGDRGDFCKLYGMRIKSLEDCLRQAHQLCRIIESSFPQIKISFDVSMAPPDRSTRTCLRRIIYAGYSDQLAIQDLNAVAGAAKKRRTAYRVAALGDELAYLHPKSALFGEPPKYLAYGQLVRTPKRVYLKYVTAIEPSWIVEPGK